MACRLVTVLRLVSPKCHQIGTTNYPVVAMKIFLKLGVAIAGIMVYDMSVDKFVHLSNQKQWAITLHNQSPLRPDN